MNIIGNSLKSLICALAALSFSAPLQADSLKSAATPDARITMFEQSVRSLKDRKDPNAQRWSIEDRMKAYNVPGTSIAIIQNGKIIHAKGYGLQSNNASTPVDRQTVFSAGSVSKVVNAALILRLVQEGILNLDQDVNSYLKSWKVPDGEYTRSKKVTLRHLLSHTSGFSQHGFPDFKPGEKLPTSIQTLNGIGPAKHRAVKLMFEPGQKMDYSGGGITVAQLVVEDVMGQHYNEVAKKYLFEPLGMKRSTFVNPLPETHGNIARSHNKKGKARALPRGYESMPEMAASGLWTSAEDMALFVQAVLINETFLSPEMRGEMLSRAPLSWHGMGPRLNGAEETLVFHHGGANDNYKSWIEGHPAHGNGIVILTNGEAGRELGYEIRIAAGEAFGWSISFPEDFSTPKFDTPK
ncbi:serine hydrolase domain-containing protein [Parasphingorhabdus cellanae]|nr:serine hydrolase domain-containing protein [Parasphingorhabdus cellanae]